MYFDPTLAAHKALLPQEYREASELSRLADEAEADVLGHYTEVGEDGVSVKLEGYSATPTETSVELAQAIRREIAAVIVWRHQRERLNLMHQSESKNDKSVTLSPQAYDLFPPGFGRWLKPFDTRTRQLLWSI